MKSAEVQLVEALSLRSRDLRPNRHRDPSTRWKEIVEPAPGRFTHPMELRSPEDIDAEVRARLQEAWAEAS